VTHTIDRGDHRRDATGPTPDIACPDLPGDIRISSGNTRIYIPITSMLLVSAALNVFLWLFLSLFRR
jgi:hypothetical protein